MHGGGGKNKSLIGIFVIITSFLILFPSPFLLARVCIRNDFAELQARLAVLEAANARTTGTATAGASVTIMAQTIERSGRVVTVNMRMNFTANRPDGSVIVTLPDGFRPSQQLIVPLMRGHDTGDRVMGLATVHTDGRIVLTDNSGARIANNRHMLSFSFIQ